MAGKRYKPSGPNISDAERHTEKLTARVSPELAERIRALCTAQNKTLAQILAAGVEKLEAPRFRQGDYVTDGEREGLVTSGFVSWVGGGVSALTAPGLRLSTKQAFAKATGTEIEP